MLEGSGTMITMGVLGLIGLFQAITGNPLWMNMYGRYTDEFVRKFARPAGVLIAIIGALGVAFFYLINNGSVGIGFACFGVAMIFAIIYIVLLKKTLVKVNKKK